jgi:hypothetical protein
MSTSLFVNVVVLAGFIAVTIVGHFIFLAGSQSFLMNYKFAIRNPDTLLVLNSLVGKKDFDFINQGGNEISESSMRSSRFSTNMNRSMEVMMFLQL